MMRAKKRDTNNPTLRTAVSDTPTHLGYDRNHRMSVIGGRHEVEENGTHTSTFKQCLMVFTFESEHRQFDSGDPAAPRYHRLPADKQT